MKIFYALISVALVCCSFAKEKVQQLDLGKLTPFLESLKDWQPKKIEVILMAEAWARAGGKGSYTDLKFTALNAKTYTVSLGGNELSFKRFSKKEQKSGRVKFHGIQTKLVDGLHKYFVKASLNNQDYLVELHKSTSLAYNESFTIVYDHSYKKEIRVGDTFPASLFTGRANTWTLNKKHVKYEKGQRSVERLDFSSTEFPNHKFYALHGDQGSPSFEVDDINNLKKELSPFLNRYIHKDDLNIYELREQEDEKGLENISRYLISQKKTIKLKVFSLISVPDYSDRFFNYYRKQDWVFALHQDGTMTIRARPLRKMLQFKKFADEKTVNPFEVYGEITDYDSYQIYFILRDLYKKGELLGEVHPKKDLKAVLDMNDLNMISFYNWNTDHKILDYHNGDIHAYFHNEQKKRSLTVTFKRIDGEWQIRNKWSTLRE